MIPQPQYKLVFQMGATCLLFNMAVEVEGLLFEGTDSVKKEAKMNAGENALHTLQFPSVSPTHISSKQTDFPNQNLGRPY